MFSFIFKRVRIGRTVKRDSSTQLGFLQNPSFLKYFSSKASTNEDPFVVSYLISSCGLSRAAAISASMRIRFETCHGPDSVLALLRNHGFAESQISSLIRKYPLVLVASPTENLLPKLDFFNSFGVSNADTVKILSKDPRIFLFSLENKIIPAFSFLKSSVGSLEKVVYALNRQPRIISCDIQNMARNIAILKKHGVTESNIKRLLIRYPEIVMAKYDRFQEKIDYLLLLGFNTSKYLFLRALYVLISMNESTWKKKLDIYQSWGFTEDEIHMAFARVPSFMSLSEKNITSHMDFFVNKMGWQLALVMTDPRILGLSLEKRILPRWSLFQILKSKGLVKQDRKMGYLLKLSEKQFLERFVIKYEKEVPQLLDLYKRNANLLGLGDGSEELGSKNLL